MLDRRIESGQLHLCFNTPGGGKRRAADNGMSCDSHKRIAMGDQSIQAAEPKSQQPLSIKPQAI
jgi:hypothetical protein